MRGSMLGGLPVFCEHLKFQNSVLVPKDYLEMMICIARQTNSPHVTQTFSSVPLVPGQLSEKKAFTYLSV